LPTLTKIFGRFQSHRSKRRDERILKIPKKTGKKETTNYDGKKSSWKAGIASLSLARSPKELALLMTF
jgi:hypothetical protein